MCYLLLFIAVITLTEALLRYFSSKRPAVEFFTYSLIIFGCQAHLLGALSNIDGSYYLALLKAFGIPVTKMLDYVIFIAVFSPLSLSLSLSWHGRSTTAKEQTTAQLKAAFDDVIHPLLQFSRCSVVYYNIVCKPLYLRQAFLCSALSGFQEFVETDSRPLLFLRVL